MAKGRAALDKALPGVLELLVDRLPAILIDTLREQWTGLTEIDQHEYWVHVMREALKQEQGETLA